MSGEAFVRFNASSRTTLIFRAFSFEDKADHSYPELVSTEADFWTDHDSDWNISDVVVEDGKDVISVAEGASLQLTADGYPLVVAGLSLGGSYLTHAIPPDGQTGSSWLPPVLVSPTSVSPGGEYSVSSGLVLGKPALVLGANYITAENVAGTVWSGAWEFVSGTGLSFAYALVYEHDGQPVVCGGKQMLVYSREPISQDWNLASSFDTVPYHIRNNAAALINGRPAMVFGDYTQNPDLLYTKVDVYFTIASDPIGGSWAEPTLIGSYAVDDGIVLQPVALAQVDGMPAVLLSYLKSDWISPIYDGGIPTSNMVGGFHGFYYCSASDAEGQDWFQPRPALVEDWRLDGLHGVQGWTAPPRCLADVDGRPAFVFLELERGDRGYGHHVVYCEAKDNQGQDWQAPQPAAQLNNISERSVRGFVECAGQPAILLFHRGDSGSGTDYSPELPEARLRFARR